MKKFLRYLAVIVLRAVVDKVTPEIGKVLEKFALELYAKVQKTKNPYDDILAKALLSIVDIK